MRDSSKLTHTHTYTQEYMYYIYVYIYIEGERELHRLIQRDKGTRIHARGG